MGKKNFFETDRISKSPDLSLSVFLHLLIISLVFLLSYTKAKKVIVPYTVTIVDSIDLRPSPKESETETTRLKETKNTKKNTIPLKEEKINKEWDERVKERISALEAKKKIKDITELRKKIIDINSSIEKKDYKGSSKEHGTALSSKDYYSMVIAKIKDNWVYPDSLDKDLLTIVVIKVTKDGAITIDRIEKRSGNPLFDRSVLVAINRSNPLPPPGEDIELGIRFRP